MQVESYAKDVNELCTQHSNTQAMTITNLGGRTVAAAATAAAPATKTSSAQWKKVEMKPVKKHVSLPTNDTRVGMAVLAADWSPIDHLVLGHFAAKLDPPKPDFSPGVVFMEVCGDSAVVHTLSGGRKKIAGGSIRLAGNMFLVLDQTCAAVQLKNLVIEGGYVVCHGKGCDVTFTNVTFKDCCLVTMAQARATLSGVTFSNSTDHLLSLVSKDSGSRVTMDGGSIRGGENGVLVSQGARLEASGITIQNILGVGVKAQTNKTVLTLTDCILKDFLSIRKLFPATEGATEGVFLRNQCSATLTNVTVNNADVGVLAANSAAVMTDCQIEGSVEKAVDLKSRASLLATRCSLSRSGPGPMRTGVFSGLVAQDSGTSATVNNCTFAGNNESAVSIIGGATVVVSDCKADGNKGVNTRDKSGVLNAAFNVIGSGKMTVINTTVVGKAAACSASVEAVGVKLNGLRVGK